MGANRHAAVAVLISALAQHFGDTVQVLSHVDPQRPTKPFVRVARVGGPRYNEVTDGPMVTFTCWHPDSAETLTNHVAQVIASLVGSYVEYTDDNGEPAHAWINRYEEVGGPAQQPDPDVPDMDRWVYTARLGVAMNA